MSSAYDLLTIKFQKKKHFEDYKRLFQNLKAGILYPITKTGRFEHIEQCIRRRVELELGNTWIGTDAADFEMLTFDERALAIEAHMHSAPSRGWITVDRIYSLLTDVPLIGAFSMSYSTRGGGESFVSLDQNGDAWFFPYELVRNKVEDRFSGDHKDSKIFAYIGQLVQAGEITGIPYTIAPLSTKYGAPELTDEYLTEAALKLKELKENFDRGYEVFYLKSRGKGIRRVCRKISNSGLDGLF